MTTGFFTHVRASDIIQISLKQIEGVSFKINNGIILFYLEVVIEKSEITIHLSQCRRQLHYC